MYVQEAQVGRVSKKTTGASPTIAAEFFEVAKNITKRTRIFVALPT
jgi:hypothetical protein